MRKDVKFGLTVAGILIATLVVYVIVLSGGGLNNASKQDQRTSLAVNGSDTAAPTTPAPAPTNDTQVTPAPTHNDNIPPAPALVTPPPALADVAPATRPQFADNTKPDWDYRLNHGDNGLSSEAPQHTETPTIDRTGPAAPPTVSVTRANRPPTIDDAMPMLAAPAVQPMKTDAPAADAPKPDAPKTDSLVFVSGPTTQQSPQFAMNDDTLVNGPVPPIVNKPSSSAQVSTAAQHTHKVASGESLWTIAQAIYGDGSYYTKIVAANPGLDASHLKVGKVLNIPDVSPTEKQAAATNTAKPEPTIDPNSSYRVTSGDTLEKIARKLYGDPNMQDKIYDLNKTLIGDDPDKLKIDWVLKLPKAPTQNASPTGSNHS